MLNKAWHRKIFPRQKSSHLSLNVSGYKQLTISINNNNIQQLLLADQVQV